MPDSTEWTTAHLKEHLESIIAAQEKAVETALAAQERAVSAALAAAKEAVIKAENASDKRFEGVNEFRKTLSDQTSEFIPRREVDSMKEGLLAKVANLGDNIGKLDSRVTLFEGRSKGIGDGWAWIIAAISAVGTIVAIFIALSRHS